MPASSHATVSIVFVAETETLPGNFAERTIALRPTALARFDSTWQNLKPQVLARVREDSLFRISRWAREQMKKFVLPPGWLEDIPLRPIASAAHGRFIRFGQSKEEGYPLPSHRPLVFRRLLLFMDYDLQEQMITRVIVTISGWVEE